MLPVVRFGLDEIPRGLPGEQSHQIDKARIGPGRDERNRGFRRRIGDHAKPFGCRCSRSRHCRVLAIGRIAPHPGKDDELLPRDKGKCLTRSMCCIAFER